MKKLINYLLNDFRNSFFYYAFGFFFLGVVLDFSFNTFITSVTGPFIVVMFMVIVMFGYGDVYGLNAIFIQTLPYNRGKVLTAKWILQSIMTFILTLTLSITILVLLKASKTNTIEDLGLMALFFPFIWLGFILLTDLGQFIVYVILKIQRRWLQITTGIICYSVLIGLLSLVAALVASSNLNDIMVLIYWILGFILSIAIIKVCSYVLYKRIDIPAVNDAQIQIRNLYGGRD